MADDYTMDLSEPCDSRGNPLPGKEPPKNPECLACKEDIPFKWNPNAKRFQHLDLFATYEYGCIFDCPVRE